jgi:hypothetical protein
MEVMEAVMEWEVMGVAEEEVMEEVAAAAQEGIERQENGQGWMVVVVS